MSIFYEENRYGKEMKIGWIITIVISSVIIGSVTLGFAAGIISYNGEKKSCQVYSQQVGRQTKFVDNFPYWWSCQVKTDSGFIEYDKLQQIETPNLINKETK